MLRQEGWHYEIESPDDPLTYKGVVYNEMKVIAPGATPIQTPFMTRRTFRFAALAPAPYSFLFIDALI